MHRIDIKEPIWKSPRSVGLNVVDIPLGEKVEVSISYRNKDGKLLWPDNWVISADEVKRYPSKAVRSGIILNLVPIEDLNKLNIKPQKIVSMLFDKKSLDKIITASEENKGGSNKKNVEPGKHILTLSSIKLDHSKKDGNPMIVIELTKDDEHRPFKEFFKIAGPNTDIPREKLVRLFHRGFGYSIQACKDEQGLIDQLVKFQGKQLTVAVKGRKKVISYEKDGQDQLLEVIDPQFWYCGTAKEYAEMKVDLAKAITDLTDEDKDKLIKFSELNATEATPEPVTVEKTEPAPTPKAADPVEDEGDEFPF